MQSPLDEEVVEEDDEVEDVEVLVEPELEVEDVLDPDEEELEVVVAISASTNGEKLEHCPVRTCVVGL